MTEKQIAELQTSRHRWRLAALTTWVLLAITVFFMGIFVVYSTWEVRRHEMQAERAAREAERKAIAAQAAVREFLEKGLLNEAEKRKDDGKERPPGTDR